MMGVQHKTVGIGFGIATALYIANGLGEPGPAMLALVASTGGCMLPDIDHDRTKLGRKRNFVTTLLSKTSTTVASIAIIACAVAIVLFGFGVVNAGIDLNIFLIGLGGSILFLGARKFLLNNNTFKWMTKHRGLMHTLVLPIAFIILAFSSEYAYWRYMLLGLAIGYLSHLLADMLTVEGCPVLWPLTKNNIRFLKLKTSNGSTWIAAVLLAALPVVIVLLKFGV